MVDHEVDHEVGHVGGQELVAVVNLTLMTAG